MCYDNKLTITKRTISGEKKVVETINKKPPKEKQKWGEREY